MNRKIHLISNAHLDPIWQWEWEEGVTAAISTFRCAADFCTETDGYIFCHNEALLYRWIEEYEPDLFFKIQKLVSEGKWHIMGGWELQPDCNMPSGEGFIRQILTGRHYFLEKFGAAPRTAINFDSFGHSRGLVQILAKSGFDSYLCWRPTEKYCHLPASSFTWVGYDGSKITTHRAVKSYNSALGQAIVKIRKVLDLGTNDGAPELCLWGVGNHGGGASREDLKQIAQFAKECEKEGIELIHSTPEAFFDALRASEISLPEHQGDLNPWGPGCYTSQALLKRRYRAAENMYFSCEKMASHLASVTDFVYPEKELEEAMRDILLTQFHDVLPGTTVQPAEESALRTLNHAMEILSRIRMRAFLKLAQGQKKAADGEIPVLVYNPHPYPVTGDFSCEFSLADQNWSGTYMMPTVFRGEEALPTQCEKELSNIPIDWRKRVVFHATLEPMSLNRFDCRLEALPEKPVPSVDGDEKTYFVTTPFLTVQISRITGLVDSIVCKEVEYVRPCAFSLDVIRDDADPWGMTVDGWRERVGQFTLLSDGEATAYLNVDTRIRAIRPIEDGAVRTVIEAIFGYYNSRAIVHYIISKTEPRIEMNIRIFNQEKSKMIRLNIPQGMKDVSPAVEVAFGEEPMRTGQAECVGQKYMTIRSNEGCMTVLNNGIYGSSFDEQKQNIQLTLLRAAGYCTHPVPERNPVPQDRYSAYIDQGEREYSIAVLFGREHEVGKSAQLFNEQPIAFSFFPSGDGVMPTSAPITVEGEGIVMTAFKKATVGDRFVVRLFNPQHHAAEAKIVSETFGCSAEFTLGQFEVKTFFLDAAGFEECDMIENLTRKLNV